MPFVIRITRTEEYTKTERIMEKDAKGSWEYVDDKVKQITDTREVSVLEQRVESLDFPAVIKAINGL
jgi:hypothetical protein